MSAGLFNLSRGSTGWASTPPGEPVAQAHSQRAGLGALSELSLLKSRGQAMARYTLYLSLSLPLSLSLSLSSSLSLSQLNPYFQPSVRER